MASDQQTSRVQSGGPSQAEERYIEHHEHIFRFIWTRVDNAQQVGDLTRKVFPQYPPTLTLVPTEIPPTVPPLPTQPASPASSGTILITQNDQTLAFTCKGNAAEVRGNANTDMLLGSCGNITVKGNANVIYGSGSPIITDTGNENVITNSNQ